MLQLGSRTIKVNKAELIAKINENKEKHILDYAEAVVAYKTEALEQLVKLVEKVENGSTQIELDLRSPVNNSDNYDKIIEMFKWEVAEEVELSQAEFREYVQDEAPFAISARTLNALYKGGGSRG